MAAHLQTTIGEPSGENADVANALLGVSFSLAIFVAGVLGAVLISGDNGLALPIVMIALAIIAFSVVAGAAFSLPQSGLVRCETCRQLLVVEGAMRSSVPIPGNSWPHDMLLTVEDDPHALVDLLWIRETWSLKPVGDELPPLLSDRSVGAHIETDTFGRIGTWQDAWPAMWEACLNHAGRVRDEALLDQLRGTADGSDERAELLHQLIGPTWRDEFGDEAFTDQYETWNLAKFDARSRRRRQALEEEPERVSLAALIPAWHAGLSTIVVIPCLGSYTRVIGQYALIVTSETRDDPNRYTQALKQFR